jgi:hypothetical protein
MTGFISIMVAVGAPVITSISPGVSLSLPQVITGEGFDAGETEVWCWTPPAAKADGDAEIRDHATAAQRLPAQPPADARKMTPYHIGKQTIAAPVTGPVCWVRTREGWSASRLVGIARPFRLSPARTRPGMPLTIIGQGLREDQGECRIALLRDGQVTFATEYADARSGGLVKDRYLVACRVPANMAPAQYTVLIHNGTGGRFGWVQAGVITIDTNPPVAEKTIDVRAYGANGADRQSDEAAIHQALTAAAPMRATVLFPTGVFLVETTLAVPPGVTLRGAARGSSIVEGIGFDPAAGTPSAPLITLGEGSRLDSLSLHGGVRGGVACERAPVVAILGQDTVRRVRDTVIVNCRIARTDGVAAEMPVYLTAVYARWTQRLRLASNAIHGSVSLLDCNDADILRNEIRRAQYRGTALEYSGERSLLDSNTMLEQSGRLLLHPWRWNCIRFNEVLESIQGTWMTGESGAFHVGPADAQPDGMRVGGVTTGGNDTLTVRDAGWAPGVWAGAVVVITDGRGFGQYRSVSANTADTVTVSVPWDVPPDAGSRFWLGRTYLENAFHGNVAVSMGTAIAWHSGIGNVIECHFTPFANSADIPDQRQQPTVAGFCWANVFLRNRLEGGYFDPLGACSRPGGYAFANLFVGNRLVRPTWPGHTSSTLNPGIAIGVTDVLPDKTSTVSYSITAGNTIAQAPVGIVIGANARNSIVLENHLVEVRVHVVDHGIGTIRIDAGKRTGGVP